jgi:hypothetical protein
MPERPAWTGSRANGDRCDPRDSTIRPWDFDAVQALIQIEPGGVRVDVMMPLTTIETWIPVARRSDDFVEVEEQVAAHKRVVEFFRRHSNVRINGRRVDLDPQRLRFVGLDDMPAVPDLPARRLSAWTARVAMSGRYASADPPRQVSVVWEMFNPAVLSARAIVVDGGRCWEHRFSTYDPRFAWPGEPVRSE